MRYYKLLNSGNLIAIGTGAGGIEIDKEEYDTLLAEIQHKASFTNQLYKGDIMIEDVPEEFREEIQKRVDKRKQSEDVHERNRLATTEDYVKALKKLGVSVDEKS